MNNNISDSYLNVIEDDFKTYPAYRAGVLIWKIVPPILLAFGTIGNFLSILVLTRRSIRSSTTAQYLIGLACSDLIVLYSGLFRQWLIYLFEKDIREISSFGCKLNIWLVYTSLDFSAWILMAVTIERVISAWLPHRARSMCTKKAAFALMISIGVFLLILNSHMVYGMGFKDIYDNDTDTHTVAKCVEVDSNYTRFFNHTWPWIDLCAFCVLPFIAIVVGNTMILFKVIKSQRKARGQIVPSTNNAASSQRPAQQNHGKQSSMTAMLFTLNIVFLFSTSPVSIYNIGYAHWLDGASNQKTAELDLWWAIVNMFMYTNNSLNFLLYCLSGTKFRREVKRIFCQSNVFNRQTQMNLSKYTRTRFDNNADQSPSTKRSVNLDNPEGPSYSHLKNETKIISNSNNNLLHPDSALRDVTTTHPIQTVSETVDKPVQKVIETASHPIQTVGGTVDKPIQKVSETRSQPIQSVSETDSKPIQTESETVRHKHKTVNETDSKPIRTISETVSLTNKTVSETTSQPIQIVSETVV